MFPEIHIEPKEFNTHKSIVLTCLRSKLFSEKIIPLISMRTWQWGWRNSIFPKLSFRETFYYEIRNPTNRETIEEINIKNTSWNFWNRKAIEISRSENATNEMRRPDKPLQNLPQHLNESQMDRLSLLPQRPKSSILSTDPKLKKWENVSRTNKSW